MSIVCSSKLIQVGVSMLDLRKTAESLFKFLEENDIKDINELPPEHLKLWLFLKDGQRLNLYMGDIDERKEAEVIPIKRRSTRQASP